MARYRNPHIQSRSKSVQAINKQNSTSSALIVHNEQGVGEYIGATLALFSKVDSIFAGSQVDCIADSYLQAPAATDGKSIYFSTVALRKLAMETNLNNAVAQFAVIRGLNLHEVAHIKYTPRTSSKFYSALKHLDSDYVYKFFQRFPNTGLSRYEIILPLKVFNILEDQRIETLLTAKFPNSIAYLQNAVLHFITGNLKSENRIAGSEENIEERKRQEQTDTVSVVRMHLLVHGRKYLSLRSRQLVAEATNQWLDEEAKQTGTLRWNGLAKMEELIDEYRQMALPSPANNDRALEIIEEFCNLWNTSPFSSGHHGSNTPEFDDHTNRTMSGGSQTDNAKKQQQVLDELDEESDEESDEDESSPSGDRPEDSEDSEDSDEDSDSDGDGDDTDGDESKDTRNSGEPSQGKSASHDSKLPQSLPNPIAKLKEQIEQEQVKAVDESTKNDIVRTLANIHNKVETNGLDSLFRKTEEPIRVEPASAHPVFVALSNRLTSALRELKADSDHQWELGSNSGSLDVARWISAQGRHLDVFNKWLDEGDERPDAEVVILLDQSGSMASHCPTSKMDGTRCWDGTATLLSEASNMAWAIKKACQANEIPCTVVGYSGLVDTALLYKANSTVSCGSIPVFAGKNSTEPDVALRMAYSIFSKSEAKNKLLFSLSDGEWHISYKTVDIVKSINKLANTFFVALPQTSYSTGVVRYPDAVLNGGTINWETNERYTAGYNHHKLIKVDNLVTLTKTIGKEIIKACQSSNH